MRNIIKTKLSSYYKSLKKYPREHVKIFPFLVNYARDSQKRVVNDFQILIFSDVSQIV